MSLDTAPKLRKKSNFAFALQTTTSVPATLSATNGITNIFNANITHATEDVPRDSQGNVSKIQQAKGARSGKATFDFELVGSSATGGTPSWLPILQACGMTLTGSVLTPLTSPTVVLTVAHWIDGRRKLLSDCMGNLQFRFRRGQKAMVHAEFTGVRQPTIDQANILPTCVTAPIAPRAGASCTFAGQACRVADIVFDQGNVVSLREDAGSVDTNGIPTGYRSAMITDRTPTFTFAPEAFTLANFDPFVTFDSLALNAFTITLGVTAGNIFTIAAPKLQIMDDPANGDRAGIYTDDLKLLATRNTSLGDDEYSISLG